MNDGFHLEDYYDLLGLNPPVAEKEIKAAFRKKAHFWHSDHNQSPDATSMMQRLLEAHKILLDPDAKLRYDRAYERWKNRQVETRRCADDYAQAPAKHASSPKAHESTACDDSVLEKWINAARRQAAEELSDFLKQLPDAGHAALSGALQGVMVAFVCILLLLLLGAGMRR